MTVSSIASRSATAVPQVVAYGQTPADYDGEPAHLIQGLLENAQLFRSESGDHALADGLTRHFRMQVRGSSFIEGTIWHSQRFFHDENSLTALRADETPEGGVILICHELSATSVNGSRATDLPVLPSRRSTGWTRLSESIDRWSCLPVGWEGADSVPPTPQMVAFAKSFVGRARAAGIPVPSGYVAGDGEIGFRWRLGEAFASAAFVDDGHLIIFCRAPGFALPLKMDQPYHADLDLSHVWELLQKFS